MSLKYKYKRLEIPAPPPFDRPVSEMKISRLKKIEQQM